MSVMSPARSSFPTVTKRVLEVTCTIVLHDSVRVRKARIATICRFASGVGLGPTPSGEPMTLNILWPIAGCGALALLFALALIKDVLSQPEGNDKMKEI